MILESLSHSARTTDSFAASLVPGFYPLSGTPNQNYYYLFMIWPDLLPCYFCVFVCMYVRQWCPFPLSCEVAKGGQGERLGLPFVIFSLSPDSYFERHHACNLFICHPFLSIYTLKLGAFPFCEFYDESGNYSS